MTLVPPDGPVPCDDSPFYVEERAFGLPVNEFLALIEPAPKSPTPIKWPDAIAFLRFVGIRKTIRCQACGGSKKQDVAAYTGEELTWRLCRLHAVRAADWAVDHLPALVEARNRAAAVSAAERAERIAAKMQDDLLSRLAPLFEPPEPADGANVGTSMPTASEPDEPSVESSGHGGNGQELTSVAGVSEPVTKDSAIASKGGKMARTAGFWFVVWFADLADVDWWFQRRYWWSGTQPTVDFETREVRFPLTVAP